MEVKDILLLILIVCIAGGLAFGGILLFIKILSWFGLTL